MHVSGVSRSSINRETEAEVVLIGTIIAPEKFHAFCCWAYLHFFWSWLNEDCLWALILAVSQRSEDDRMEELYQLQSLHLVPQAPRQSLHGSEGGSPRAGKWNLPRCCFSWFYFILFHLISFFYFYFFLPQKDAQLLPPLDLPSLCLCARLNLRQPQNLT